MGGRRARPAISHTRAQLILPEVPPAGKAPVLKGARRCCGRDRAAEQVRLPSIPACISQGPAWAREPLETDISQIQVRPWKPTGSRPQPVLAVTGSVLSSVSRACNPCCPGWCWKRLLKGPGPAAWLASRLEAEVTENHLQAFSAGPIHAVLAAWVLSFESALLAAAIIRDVPSRERSPACP